MAAFFLDTSALVKRHVIELGSGWVRSLSRPASGHTLFLSRLTGVELIAAVTRRQRGGSLSAAQAEAIIGHFRKHLSRRYQILEVTPTLLADAMRVARSHGLRAYDAVQLATAIQASRLYQSEGLAAVTLVSADRELNDAARAEGLGVEDPNSHA